MKCENFKQSLITFYVKKATTLKKFFFDIALISLINDNLVKCKF